MMSETTERPEVQALPEALQEALSTIAGFGPGAAMADFEMPDGRSMMVEVSMRDITGWEEER